MLTEEHVTRKLAIVLASKGHEVIAVHPPGGQGPFVIPVDSVHRGIERGSIHPDLVSISNHDENGRRFLVLGECKIREDDLLEDLEKFRVISGNRRYLSYLFFRCQLFKDGPTIGFDYDEILSTQKSQIPLQFVLAAVGTKSHVLKMPEINGFQCTKYLFSKSDLIS